MNIKRLLPIGMAAVLSLPLLAAIAVENEQLEQKEQAQVQQQVYGWQLMTDEERAEHRAKMRSATSDEERQAYREEHHKLMQARAEAKGLSLPDQPRQRGFGFGRGYGCRGGGQGNWQQ